jgi:hypothetical protein
MVRMVQRKAKSRGRLLLIGAAALAVAASTLETCACGAKYPLWRHVTRNTIEPPLEAILRRVWSNFAFPRNAP